LKTESIINNAYSKTVEEGTLWAQFGYMQNIDDLLMQFTIGRFAKFGKSVQFGNALTFREVWEKCAVWKCVMVMRQLQF
jgi:hypothetical protein